MSTTMPTTPGYPAQYLSLQPNLPPLSVRRALTAEEQLLKQQGMRQWFGEVFPHLGTELWQLMSDPKKQASLWGHVSGVFGGMWGAAAANAGHIMHPHLNSPHTWIALGAGSLLAGLPVAALKYFAAKQNNGNLAGIWPYLPERPTYRDYLSDAVANQVAPIRVTQANALVPSALKASAVGTTAVGLAPQRNAMRQAALRGLFLTNLLR